MVRVSGFSTSVVRGRFWCAAILTAAGAIGAAPHAEAALYDSQDSEPGLYRSASNTHGHRQKAQQHSGKKNAVEKETAAKPQGPLIVAVSISHQQVKIYDANGFFAEAPVSTGMAGHSTPTGVFSVIQKHKLHHSNIYSGAPMPFMQRITWSGVALHAGVLPGYPASHGCIRMPTGFAVKMWNWTKMGARIIVTPGEIATPASFSHPLLPSLKVVPQPVVAEEPHLNAPPAAKADKGAAPELKSSELKSSELKSSETKPSTAATNLELRSTVGHNAVTPVGDVTPVTLREQTHTADAKSTLTMSDAPAGNNAPAHEDHAAATDSAVPDGAKVDSATTDMAKAENVKAESVKADSVPSTRDATESAKPAETATAEVRPVGADASGKPEDKPAASADAPKEDGAKTEPAKAEATKAEATKAEAVKIEPARPDPMKADTAKSGDRPSEAVKASNDAGASVPDAKPDAKKDQSRLAKPEAPKRTGQIAVFISRKDSKIYVRQNFAPLFDAPVTIAPSDRPLGTHIFTAEVDRNDANALHWSVVSLPGSARSAQRSDDEERGSRRRKGALASAEAKPLPVPDSATEALDRITLPPDTMTRISEVLTTGGSIIVSDHGINQGETGEGTDFIVSLR
jgi:lipoprotein-anchoring transpeptidase ErfK/SrfK